MVLCKLSQNFRFFSLWHFPDLLKKLILCWEESKLDQTMEELQLMDLCGQCPAPFRIASLSNSLYYIYSVIFFLQNISAIRNSWLCNVVFIWLSFSEFSFHVLWVCFTFALFSAIIPILQKASPSCFLPLKLHSL